MAIATRRPAPLASRLGRAVHCARRRRRLRREELHLCRACADPVGGEACRSPGEVDRDTQRRLRLRPSGARSSGRRRAGARCAREGSSRCASPASPTSAPTWPAVLVACRPTSTSICKARSIGFPPSRCTSVTVLSNTTPIGVTRAPGFAEAVNIIERLIDAAAPRNAASTGRNCAAATWSRPRRCR